jgi:hypothetical protein
LSKRNRFVTRKRSKRTRASQDPSRNQTRTASNEVILLNAAIVGCTCGKTIGFIGLHKKQCALCGFQPSSAEKPLFNTEREQEVASVTLRILKQFERLARSKILKNSENIQTILERVQTATAAAPNQSPSVTVQVEVQNIASKTIDLFIDNSIDIPKIVLVPRGQTEPGTI